MNGLEVRGSHLVPIPTSYTPILSRVDPDTCFARIISCITNFKTNENNSLKHDKPPKLRVLDINNNFVASAVFHNSSS